MQAGEESPLRIGVAFPHAEIGTDPGAVRDFVQAADALGFSHIHIYDHVLGGAPESVEAGRYSSRSPFHEPLTLGAFIAAATARIEIVTGVLVLPQRQTALVAKQAAEVDLLSAGRLILGVGSGWNELEYAAMSVPFSRRGDRLEEQAAVLRRLWAEPTVNFNGKFHTIANAGINPRPHRAIPLWFGGEAKRAVDRATRIGDGWFPLRAPTPELAKDTGRIRERLRSEGRSPAEFAICGYANYEGGDSDRWMRQREAWQQVGATHMTVRTTPPVLVEPREGVSSAYHIEAVERYAAAMFGA